MSKETLKRQIKEAIEQSEYHKDIRRVSLFGSYAYGVPKTGSDIDLLVEFVPTANIGLFEYVGMHNYLSTSLQTPVDLVTPSSLSRYIREEVLGRAETVYERPV